MIFAALLLAAAATPAAATGITSLGRDVAVTTPVSGRVVAVFANVRVEAAVSHDVIVWGGDVILGPSGRIDGNLSVFGGDVVWKGAGPLPVAGTVSTPGSLLRLYLSEMERAPWRISGQFATIAGLRLIGLALWLAVGLVLLYAFGSPFARAAAHAETDWSGAMIAGVLGILTLFVTAAAALAILPASVSVPIALVIAALGVAAKIFGMGALFLLIGQKWTGRLSPAGRPSSLAIGFSFLGAISLLPIVGPVAWSAASIIAVGISLTSRFGTPRFRVRLG